MAWTEYKTPVAISYSGGSSSEYLLELVIQGEIPRPEHLMVVSADTGFEHEWTYEAMAHVRERCQQAGIDFVQVAADENIEDAQLRIPHMIQGSRLDQPPYWLKKFPYGRGKAAHRCTRFYKIAPMRRAISEWLEVRKLPKQITKWVGFGADEAGRAIKTQAKLDVTWERVEFPAIRLGHKRAAQRGLLEKWTRRAPRFSMCIGCPAKSPRRWFETSAADLKRAIAVDEAIRDCTAIGLDNPAYLTDRLIPIERLVRDGDPQPALPGLESYCDGGFCFL